ncbi:ATP-grasp domain-containing protein [bacterium]|nr:ATP-grasp domain-containing protein [bacterium]
MKKTILILNGSHSEVPLIKSAKKIGLNVITSGNDAGLIGHKYSNRYIKADFANKNLMLQIAKKNKIDFICPPAHDLGIITASYIAKKLNLPGFDNPRKTEIVHHKNKFKSFCKKINFKTPKVFDQNYDYEYIRKTYKINKLIIKPVDLGGGKGISIAYDNKSYEKALILARETSKSNEIVVEQFVEGKLHSLTTYIKRNKIIFYHHDNELSFKNPFNVHSSFAPGTLSNKKISLIIKQLEFFSQKLNLVDGILHAQIISNEFDFFIIELTRRCSGDFYPIPVEFVKNVPWSEIIVKSFMGKRISFSNMKITKKLFARYCLTANKNGTAKRIFIDPLISKNIISKFIYLKDEEIIIDFENKKCGVYILEFSTLEEMISKMCKINELIFIET